MRPTSLMALLVAIAVACAAPALAFALDMPPPVSELSLAQRIAQDPANQLEMITWALNDVADKMYDPASSRRLGTLFDGMARHSQEGADFVARSQEVGFREAVRERDRPFGDYGERPKG